MLGTKLDYFIINETTSTQLPEKECQTKSENQVQHLSWQEQEMWPVFSHTQQCETGGGLMLKVPSPEYEVLWVDSSPKRPLVD